MSLLSLRVLFQKFVEDLFPEAGKIQEGERKKKKNC
jgi:hypothetical protein